MMKQEFLALLREKLKGLPSQDLEERLAFYSEMISDRMDDGMSEEEAVAAIGTVDEVATQILEETPLIKIVADKVKPKHKLAVWEIILIILGSPIWLSIAISILAVAISIYASVWAVIASIWATMVALAASSIGGFVGGIIFIASGYAFSGTIVIASAILVAGLTIFSFYGCLLATKLTLLLTKLGLTAIKKQFVRKEAAHV